MATSKDRRFRPNYIYSILSLSLVLLLLGVFGLMLWSGHQLLTLVKEQVELTVELDEDNLPQQQQQIKAWLERDTRVKKGSIRYISKDDALAEMQSDFGEELIQLDLSNPLRDAFVFSVTADRFHPDTLTMLSNALGEIRGVHSVYYPQNMSKQIGQNMDQFRWIAIVAGLLFAFIAALLIHNTNRLALYANRFLIKNMQLVGANWGFISRPYLNRSLWHGVLSAGLAIGVLLLLLWYAWQKIPGLKDVHNSAVLAIICSILVLLGIFINYTSTYYVVRKYLKMRVDDLY